MWPTTLERQPHLASCAFSLQLLLLMSLSLSLSLTHAHTTLTLTRTRTFSLSLSLSVPCVSQSFHCCWFLANPDFSIVVVVDVELPSTPRRHLVRN